MRKSLLLEWAPLACVLLALWLLTVMSGCAVSAQFMTDAQHRRRTQDRVLIDRSHGSYKGDNATLEAYRERYYGRTKRRGLTQSNDLQNGS